MSLNQANNVKNQPPIYLFCEEYENDDGIREFSILAASSDKAALKKLLQAKIEKDEYGYFAENGINDKGETYCSSNFEEGFVSYYIREEEILGTDAIDRLLQTAAYDTAFHHPENLPEILKMAIHSFAAGEGYPDVQPEPVVSALLADKTFQAMIKNAYWGSDTHITTQFLPRAMQECTFFLQDRFREDPDYFATTGGVPKCSYPENLSDLIIDSIYTVARENHLPVTAPERDANKIMRNPTLRKYFSNKPISLLIEGTPAYQEAAALCHRITQSFYLIQIDGHVPLATKVQQAQSQTTKQGRGGPIPFPERTDTFDR